MCSHILHLLLFIFVLLHLDIILTLRDKGLEYEVVEEQKKEVRTLVEY